MSIANSFWNSQNSRSINVDPHRSTCNEWPKAIIMNKLKQDGYGNVVVIFFEWQNVDINMANIILTPKMRCVSLLSVILMKNLWTKTKLNKDLYVEVGTIN